MPTFDGLGQILYSRDIVSVFLPLRTGNPSHCGTWPPFGGPERNPRWPAVHKDADLCAGGKDPLPSAVF